MTDVSDLPDDGTPERSTLEAIVALKPAYRHALVGGTLAHATAGFETLELKDAVNAYSAACTDIRSGDLGRASNMLTSQALTLDAVFTEMLSRATGNLGKYPDAVERYMRMALKAQAQSRATLEALAKMHQPREQVVRHVHVYEGGQAVVAEQLHLHGTGPQNVRPADQSYGPNSAGQGGTALLGQDQAGYGVPIPGYEGSQAVPHSRGGEPGRAEG